jgi:hypothetical protein
MGRMGKSFSLLLIVFLAVSSLIMAKPAFAQTPTPTPSTIPMPSVPVFTLKLVGPSQINSNFVGYTAVEVTIKNQPFTPYSNANGTEISFYYNIQIKTHNETDNWIDLYNTYEYNNYVDYPQQSADSDFTNMSIPVNTGQIDNDLLIPTGSKTDIQVEAMIGHIIYSFDYEAQPPGFVYSFVGVTSGWSNTQTVTIPFDIPTLTPTPTLTSVSSALNSSLLLITTIALVVITFLLAIIIFLLLYTRKQGSASSQTKITSTP